VADGILIRMQENIRLNILFLELVIFSKPIDNGLISL
jgi:hypothetical protein